MKFIATQNIYFLGRSFRQGEIYDSDLIKGIEKNRYFTKIEKQVDIEIKVPKSTQKKSKSMQKKTKLPKKSITKKITLPKNFGKMRNN